MSDSAQPLVVEVGEIAGHPCLRPIGEVDIASAPKLQEAMAEVLASGAKRWVLDMQRLSYLDSTGLGCIAAARRQTREAGGDLLLICSTARILRLLSITGMDMVFKIVRTVDEAEAELAAGRQR